MAHYTVFGELLPGGRWLALMVAGPIDHVGARLPLLTPGLKAGSAAVTELTRALAPPALIEGAERGDVMLAPATWPTLVQLAASFGAAWTPQPRLRDWITARTLERLADVDVDAVLTSPELRPDAPTPRGYQLEGAALAARTGRGLIWDDPGLGKTLTALLTWLRMRQQGRLPLAGPLLVVCPSSVVDSWARAVTTWTTLRPVPWRGSPAKRVDLIGTGDVYITGYSLAHRDTTDGGPLTRLRPVGLALDEVHEIRHRDSARSKAARRLAKGTASLLALSGTPISHDVGNLWPVLNALDPVSFSAEERFVRRYLATVPQDYGRDDVLGLEPSREPEFRAALVGQWRRLAKADVLTELPPKIPSVRMVDIPPAHRRVYDDMRDRMTAQLEGGEQLPAFDVLQKLHRLTQLACAAADVTVELVDDERSPTGLREAYHVILKAPSWKVDAALEILAERPGRQTLLFAPSRQLVMLAGTAAAAAGYRVGFVVGGQTARERTAQVDAFQAGDLDVLALTTGAGGVGLTLTAASTVVFLQRPWSHIEATQAEDRAHRIGSEIHESIEIIDIVTRDTVDTRIREVLGLRAQALADLLQDQRIATDVLGGILA